MRVNIASSLDIIGLKNYRFIDNKNEEINIINKKDNNSSLNNWGFICFALMIPYYIYKQYKNNS